ncbi:MAG: dehydrogenase [Planctomycetaceae bacterium]|nr:dehydrogenase [Planctomycetaceae bacterium]
MPTRTTRRDFLRTTAALGTCYWVSGSHSFAQSKSPNEKLNVAVIGAGKGSIGGLQNLPAVSSQYVVAICDVDDLYAGPAFEHYTKARKWYDYRRMLDQQKDIDAVIVSTPDHLHAVISVAAMRRGQHVYCEKPMARTIYESRVMRDEARKNKVVTQMGNQGTGTPTFRTAVEIIQAGGLGTVKEAHAWTDRPFNNGPNGQKGPILWSQGVGRPKQRQPTPSHLKWDLWLGPAPERPYHKLYHPFTWRGWWDFGSCVLGDMVCHNANLAYMALKLTAPTTVEAQQEGSTAETGPLWSHIQYEFPARDKLPPVTLHWYEGGKQPPAALGLGHPLPNNGSLIIGDKGTLLTLDMYCTKWKILPEANYRDYKPPEPTLPRGLGQHGEWINACKGQGKTMSNFDYASQLVEAMLVGNVAMRTGQKLQWDAEQLKATNSAAADEFIKPILRKGWLL